MNFLHNSQLITFPIHSCLVLNSFCANLQDSLIMWLIVSSLPPHYLHLLFFLHLVYICFDIVRPYVVILCCHEKRISFSLEGSFSRPCSSFFVWDFAYSLLKISIQLLFFHSMFLVFFIPSTGWLFPLFVMGMGYFSVPIIISVAWLYFLVCIRVSSSFSLFAKTFI